MTPSGRSIQQAARSQAGSPAHMSPKSTTPQKLPSLVRRFAGCRSPCSHRAGPVQSGAASASSQTSRTASGPEINPRSVVSFRRCAKPSPISASGPPRRFRPAGASSGAGRCRAARKAAKVSAASALRVAGARSAGSPATQVVTIQGRGNRLEAWPRRCGTGICNGRRGAMAGSKVCSFRSSSSASSVAQGSRTARSSPSRHN